jgi:t-SNARE complex subunit (syntaxin)
MEAMQAPPQHSKSANLVLSRLAEFRRLAQSKRMLQTPDESISFSHNTPASELQGERSVMQQFYGDVTEIQDILKEGRLSVSRLSQVLEQILQATTADTDRAALESMHEVVDATNKHMSASKSAIEALKAKCSSELKTVTGSAESRIQDNMMRSTVQKHQQLLIEFQKRQMECKSALEKRQFREMQLLCPEASENEVKEMIAVGETSSQLVARQIAGTHALLIEELQHIREKHQDILRLERSVADLHQMFQEVAVLVDAQGEMLDVIEENVHSANSYVEKANKELSTAVKVQRSNRKWECCLAIVLLIVLVAVFAPLIVNLSDSSHDPSSQLTWILILVFAVLVVFGALCCYCRYCRRGCSGSCCARSSFKKMPDLPV